MAKSFDLHAPWSGIFDEPSDKELWAGVSMAGRPAAPTTGRYGRPGRPGPAMSLSLQAVGIEQTIINLKNLTIAIKRRAARILSEIGMDLFEKAIVRTPVDTGELRESGTVTLQFHPGYVDIAHGTKDGDIVTKDVSFDNLSLFKSAISMSLLVQFYRTNVFGEDIALWTHEDLNPADSSEHPRAKQPRTGPKYLEGPWLENQAMYINWLQSLADVSYIKAATRVLRKAKSKSDIDIIAVDLNKLKSQSKVRGRKRRR